MQLHNASSAVKDVRELRNWEEMITDWDQYGTAWDRHSEKLAHTLNTLDFHRVSSAFGCLGSLARSKETDLKQSPPSPGSKPTFDPTDDILEAYEDAIDRAKAITLKASFGWWEVRARNKALSRY
jgi:hypothetical protein